jgi:pimeloyl-ACP methyl ester carboxylesterase
VARQDVDGIEIDYELVGDKGAPVVVLTPGGRFPRDVVGLPEFADALVAGGRHVLMWDRPNCGGSDMHFGGPSESDVQADALVGLLRALDLGPVTLTGGSGGARVVMIAAARNPALVSHLAIWWISGGPISLAQLAAYYCGDSAIGAARGGMAAVLALPSWAEQLSRNPRNRDIILAQDPDIFIETMQRWARAYTYSDASPVPGMAAADYARLTMPVRIYRSGKSDISHTRRTSEWVHALIPGSTLAEPPWGDQEWNERSVSPDHALFRNWPRLAPELLAFTAK